MKTITITMNINGTIVADSVFQQQIDALSDIEIFTLCQSPDTYDNPLFVGGCGEIVMRRYKRVKGD